MAQVTITLNGQTFRLRCADGQEQRLHQLVDYIRFKVDHFAEQFGQVGRERLLLMAAILIADELFDARDASDRGQAAATMAAAEQVGGGDAVPANA